MKPKPMKKFIWTKTAGKRMKALLFSEGAKALPNHALFNRHLADLPRKTR